MHGLPQYRRRTDDPPPRPTAPARRKPSIREAVDRELHGALVVGGGDLPRRPSKGWHHMAGRVTRPAGHLPERLVEHAEDGGSVERMRAALHAGVDAACDRLAAHVAALRLVA